MRVASRRMQKELAEREAARGHNTLRWFTPLEVAVAEALARVVVPSDEDTPGLDEIDGLGPPAIVALDKLVMASPERQGLYSRGLLSFDMWAIKRRGCKFAEMRKEDQIGLFASAQEINDGWMAGGSVVRKVWRRLQAIEQAKTGSLFAAQLYPWIRNDCLQVFYTSRVSWVWLDYDGPPMDKGYPSLVKRR